MALKNQVLVKLGLDDKEYNRKLKAATTKLNKATRDMTREGRRLSVTSRDIFVGLTLPMAILGKNVFDATAQMERMHLGLSTIAKSRGITAISKLIEDTERLAKLPGLGLQETFKGVQDLLSVGLTGDKALKTVEGLGIGIARAGGSAEHFARIMRQMTQALSKGKLEMQDFRTIFENLPEARRILEDTFGPGMSDLDNLRAAGLGVRDVLDAISGGFHELGSDGFMDTFANQVENLKDSWLKLRAAIGQEIFATKFQGFMDGISGSMDSVTASIRKMSPAMKQNIANWTQLVAGISVFIPLTGFVASRFKLIGAFALQYSTVLRGVHKGLTILSLSMAASNLSMARAIVTYRTGSKVLGGLKIAALATGRAFAVVGKFMKMAIPIVGELYIAYEVLASIFPGLRKEMKSFTTTISDTISGMKELITDTSIWTTLLNLLNPVGTGMINIAEVIGQVNREVREGNEAAAEAASTADAAADAVFEWESAMKGLGDTTKETVKDLSALNAFKQANRVIAITNDPKNRLLKGDEQEEIFNENAASKFQRTDVFRFPNAGVDDSLSSFQRVAEMMTGTYLPALSQAVELQKAMDEGLIGMGESGESLFETMGGIGVLSSAFDGLWDSIGRGKEVFQKAVRDMLLQIGKLIAKLVIVSVLMKIFPGLGAAVKGVGAAGGDSGGGGLLKKILGGITGFADGGIIGGSSPYGDKILARVNSGEMILNQGQQARALAQMSNNNVHITGELRARGRDLYYIFDSYNAQR